MEPKAELTTIQIIPAKRPNSTKIHIVRHMPRTAPINPKSLFPVTLIFEFVYGGNWFDQKGYVRASFSLQKTPIGTKAEATNAKTVTPFMMKHAYRRY